MNQVNGLTPRAAEIAGLWRRFFAFLIDGLILGAVGAGMGLIAFDRLMALGRGAAGWTSSGERANAA